MPSDEADADADAEANIHYAQASLCDSISL
jgi:hypothetical protein